MLTELLETLAKAQLNAIKKLAGLLETCEDPRELRRIACALLKLKLPNLASPEEGVTAQPNRSSNHSIAAKSQPAPAAAPRPLAAPLSPAELHALSIAVPSVPTHKFTGEHSPTYWRDVLAQASRQALTAPPAPRAGPNLSSAPKAA